MKDLILYYHLFAINDWEDIWHEHLSTIESSGLNKVSQLHVCVSGTDRANAISKLKNNTILFLTSEYHCVDENNYEWSTLRKLWKSVQNHGSYCLYFHTKGVTQSGQKRIHINSWRRYLNHFCISRWKDCVGALEAFADLAGCQYKAETQYYPCHYSGNFWCASSDYIKTLPDPSSFNGDRLQAEFWSCRATHKALSFCSTDVCMYDQPIYPETYIDKALEPVLYQFTA